MNYFKLLLLSLTLMFTSAANVYALDFKLEGWGEFKFGQPWDSAKEQLKERCRDWGSEGKGHFYGTDCGTWLDLPVTGVSIHGYKKNFFSGREVWNIGIDLNFSENAESRILSLITSNFEEWTKFNRCEAFDNRANPNYQFKSSETFCIRHFGHQGIPISAVGIAVDYTSGRKIYYRKDGVAYKDKSYINVKFQDLTMIK